jgi:hypothetical protein
LFLCSSPSGRSSRAGMVWFYGMRLSL